MAEAFSGLVVGYAFSLLFTAVAATMVVDARSRVPFLTKAIAPNLNAAQLAVPISLVAFVWWPLIGLVLGLAYRAARLNLAGGGLGSPNWPFTLAVLLGSLACVAVVWYAWRRVPLAVVLTVASFAAAFGWGMPHLSEVAL